MSLKYQKARQRDALNEARQLGLLVRNEPRLTPWWIKHRKARAYQNADPPRDVNGNYARKYRRDP